jgi:hypothetical protein
MKIAIVGKGTSSIITAMRLIEDGHQVDIFYDPDKPHLKIGESTTPAIAALINSVFDIGITDLINLGIVSLKCGVRFINWGVGNSFIHGFNSNKNNTIAFHFNTPKFNQFFHTKLREEKGVNYFPERVDDYKVDVDSNTVIVNEKVYDFLVFCSGWNETDEYEKPEFETVNSVLTYSIDGTIDPISTLHEATEDGWQFGLPFPQENLTRRGYLFNSNLISSEEVSEKINLKNSNKYEWTPKYAKKIIQNKFVAYNGNRLFFFDPLHALALHYYLTFASYICEYLESGKMYQSYIYNNSNYTHEIYKHQLSLAWHYRYGSIYDSKYWNNVKEQSTKFMESLPYGKMNYLLDNFSIDHINRNSEQFSIGTFTYPDFRMVHSGMTGMNIDEIFNRHIFGQ